MVNQVDKPWGHEEIWAHTDKYVAKILYIKAGHRLSKQFHEYKEETLRVESGTMELELGNKVIEMNPGDVVHIKPEMIHRMKAITDVRVYEASTTELDDVVRLEDDYDRQTEY